MSRVIIAFRGLPRVIRPAESKLAIRLQPVRRLGKIINSSQTWITYSGFDLGLPNFFQPKRGVVNRPLRLKKMPIDYPLVTGSEHWRRKVRTAFHHLDINADGYLTRDDFLTTAQTLTTYLGLSGDSAERMLNGRLDAWARIAGDKTRLTEEEYCRVIMSVMNGTHFRDGWYHTLICMEFNAMDIDGDGFISKEEHAAYYYSLNIPTEYSKDDFDIMDTNGDGLVSIDEFAEGFLEFWLTEDPNNIYNQNYGPLVD